MAVGFDTWNDRQAVRDLIERSYSVRPTLSRQERLDRIHRLRRRTMAQSALEGALWFAGSAAVVVFVLAGVMGFR